MNTAADLVDIASRKLVTGNGMDLDYVESMLSRIKTSGVDFGDIFFKSTVLERWRLSESKIKSGSFSIDQGFGVRAVVGEKTALAHSDELSNHNLHEAVRAVRAISGKLKPASGDVILNMNPDYRVYRAVNYDPINGISRERKVGMIGEMDAFARSLDPRVREVSVMLTLTDENTLLFTTEGNAAGEMTPYAILSCSVIVEENGVSENGRSASGRITDASYFFGEVPVLPFDFIRGVTEPSAVISFEPRYLATARDAVRQALLNLRARPARAGTMPVALASGWPAVLIHEAVGHGLEADACRKGESVFAGLTGQQVASPLCTVVDDGTVPDGTGSFNVDSEGVPARRNVLIENGVLKGFMYDRLNAAIMSAAPTGNGRRDDYYHPPIPRMTNTYLLPGKDSPADIIGSIDDGIYAVDFSGGQVDPVAGKFTFTATEAYRVENGEIKYPVKNATLIGGAVEVMKNISMVGDNLEFDRGIGECGKQGQSVRVGIGQPTLRIDSVTVGGSE